MDRTSRTSALGAVRQALRSAFDRPTDTARPRWNIKPVGDSTSIELTVWNSAFDESFSMTLAAQDALALSRCLKSASREAEKNSDKWTFVPGDVIGMDLHETKMLLRALDVEADVVIVDGSDTKSLDDTATANYLVRNVEPGVERSLLRGSRVRLIVGSNEPSDSA